MTHREHGDYVKYKVESCDCTPCREANRAYVSRRNRLIAYGQWQPYVDAAPARAHVKKLQAAGIGWKRIASLAGVSTNTVEKLLYGAAYRGMAPSKRVRAATAESILAVKPTQKHLSDGALVDATGTRRRLQALVAIGWSQSQLAARLGMDRSNFWNTIRSNKVRIRTARTVVDLYDQLWDTPAPAKTHRTKIAASRARNHAKKHGWPPPMAWDDDTIDDPAATAEQPVDAPRHPNAKLPPVAELRWLLEQDETVHSIAMRFKVKTETVTAVLQRSAA